MLCTPDALWRMSHRGRKRDVAPWAGRSYLRKRLGRRRRHAFALRASACPSPRWCRLWPGPAPATSRCSSRRTGPSTTCPSLRAERLAGVESARGRIAIDFGGDACEGYTLKYRQVTVLDSGETGRAPSTLRTATFEAGDGQVDAASRRTRRWRA